MGRLVRKGAKFAVARIGLTNRLLIVYLLCILAASFPINVARGSMEPLPLGADASQGDDQGTDPIKDANPASVDILEVSLTNNGTHFGFILECRATPAPSGVRAYRVYLDTRSGGATGGTYVGADFCLQGGGASGLYDWVSGSWTYKSPIEVQIVDRSIYLTASLSSIGYPASVQDPIGVVAASFQPLEMLRDRAPDTGNYLVAHNVIPELPWPTPLVFIPAVVATVYFVYTKRFTQKD